MDSKSSISINEMSGAEALLAISEKTTYMAHLESKANDILQMWASEATVTCNAHQLAHLAPAAEQASENVTSHLA